MNRTDRLLAIVLELQAHGWRRAEDLAATFEVSKRTIYRDVLALGEAGVPLVAEPGRGYRLPDGYFLPPLRFSADEAMLLLIGTDMAANYFDAEYQQILADAARKIAGALPDDRRREVAILRQSIQTVALNNLSEESAELLRHLRSAIIGQQRIQINYHTRYRNDGGSDRTQRHVDPYALVNVGRSWYLIGYCHLRQERRNFRLDRISALVMTGEHFERPPDFQVQPPRDEDRRVIVSAIFDHSIMPWVRETPSFFTIAEEDRPSGCFLSFRVRQIDEIVGWLLSWGKHVEVLEPPELRLRLATEIAAMWEKAKSLLT